MPWVFLILLTLQGASLELKPVRGERSGQARLRQTPDGIVATVEVSGSRMTPEDRVELWLSSVKEVAMPEFAWGNQFGYSNCEEAPGDEAELCSKWLSRQKEYRAQLSRLFTRCWRISQGVALETLASEAYPKVLALAGDDDGGAFSLLQPRSAPVVAGKTILIRWSDLPPAASLDLSVFYIADRFFGRDGSQSSTAPDLQSDKPETYNVFKLERPRNFAITPCEYDLIGSDVFYDDYPAYFFPADKSPIRVVP
jgi:hypothetical protein